MGFGGLYISISGINANKKALDTISHNISNANNANYVRQRVIHAESRYSQNIVTGFQLGSGVDVQQISQIRDEFLDLKIRKEMATYGYYNTKSEILVEIETIFNEITSSGLQSVMDDFWNGWTELYKAPDSLTIRGLLHENAVAFTTTVNHISTQLDNLQFNLNKEMLNSAEEVNGILGDIANLNKSIKLVEGYGGVSANDYRDSRNAKLDRLSELIPITYYENQYGEMVVTLNGRDLINGDYSNPLDIRLNRKGHGEVYWSDTGEHIDLKGKGELGGYIDARDEAVVEYRERLNILVGTIAEVINTIHKKGKGLDGVTTNKDFFEFDADNPATTIKVNPELADFNKIAASASGAKGDGEIAKAISDLRDIKLFGEYDDYIDIKNQDINGDGIPEETREISYIIDNISSLLDSSTSVEDLIVSLKDADLTMNTDDFYRDLVLSLSIKKQEASQMAENQDLLIKQVDERRQEISSVSLDEEMANMITYQHSYIANSRVINAIDEMINTVIGLVGR